MKDTVKLDQFFIKEFTPQLQRVLIIRTDAGDYELFGKYQISTTKMNNFKVEKNHPYTYTHEFTSMKNAVTWCTFDNANQFREARRIEDLDMRLSSKEVDIAIHKKMVKSAKDTDSKWIYLIKLEEDNTKKRTMLNELHSYINISKMMQERKFEETKHPGFSRLR